MAKKKQTQEPERPKYMNADGSINFNKIFDFIPKQTELLQEVVRNGKVYLQAVARQCLSYGGIRSGKTMGVLAFFIMFYCLAYKKCDVLVLRRTFRELESGAIADIKAILPPELYSYDQTKHIFTFRNGSRVVCGHCESGKERDLAIYLGTAWSAICIDEAGQFSADAYQEISARCIVNAACEADEAGNLPIPCVWACSNPLGPFFSFYKTVFIDKEPWNKPEGAKKDLDGNWWVQEAGEWRLIYNKADYACQHSTVRDNFKLLERDPGIILRLNSLPKAKRDKMLLGLCGHTDGAYYDCWDPDYHVINLRSDPEAILWQEHEFCWAGSDWGIVHANSTVFFTHALVRSSIGGDYKKKVVIFNEAVVTGGKTYPELAQILSQKAVLPSGKRINIRSIFFSHERFARSGSASVHTPADEYSRELRKYGLPAVTRATQDRIGSASLIYNMLKSGDLVVLDHCQNVITAIPSLQRNPNELDDYLKTDSKQDDVADSLRYGLFGELASRKRPSTDAIVDHARQLDDGTEQGRIAAFFYKQKMMRQHNDANAPWVPERIPQWQVKLLNQ